jgi:DNA processing protein
MSAPSANTQAVLLLTSPLLQEGEKGTGKDPVLTTAEYAQLAARLKQDQHQPADLIQGSREALLSSLSAAFAAERLQRLLSRGFQLSQAVEHWATRSITVIGRADAAYPARFKQRLKRTAPPLLYACGNLELLKGPALAVVGSRNTPEALLRQAQALGALASTSGVVVVSGAAKGVDESAMLGCLSAGGCAIGVVADGLETVSARPIWRQGLLDGRLLLLSSEAPSSRFQVWRAMERNKLIYALADAALVISSAKGEGGTWAGAAEQLERLHFCPVHALSDPRGGAGLKALAEMGARPWPDPSSPQSLQALLDGAEPPTTAPVVHVPELHRQGTLLAIHTESQASPSLDTEQPPTPAAAFATFVDDLVLKCLGQPLSIDELAQNLDVGKSEVKRWCQRLEERGLAEKLTRPVRYVRRRAPR